MQQRRAAARRGVASGAALLALLAIAVMVGCDCWYGSTCDDFTCSGGGAWLDVGEVQALSVPFCPPWDDPNATYEATSQDTTIVTATVNGQQVILTGKSAGFTYVTVEASRPRIDGHAYYYYEVTVHNP